MWYQTKWTLVKLLFLHIVNLLLFFLVRIKQPTNDITVILVNNSTPPVTNNTISNEDIPLLLLWPEDSIVVATTGIINCDNLLVSVEGTITITQHQYNNNITDIHSDTTTTYL